MSKSPDDPLLNEWAAARDVLKSFDDRIHDLRKYGFTLVTSLITLQGFLLSYIPPSGTSSGSGITDGAKFGALVATALLIIVLRWLDGNYQGFQRGAAVRAIVIERFLNLELTDQISVRYEVGKLWLPKIVLYFGFEGATIILAVALVPSLWLPIVILSGCLIGEGATYIKRASPDKRKGPLQNDDWALDRLQCTKGDLVRIMLTNLRKGQEEDRIFENGESIWEIRDKNDVVIENGECKADYQIKVRPMSSYVWSWKVNVEPGIYRILVNSKDRSKKNYEPTPVSMVSVQEDEKEDKKEKYELSRKLEVIEKVIDKEKSKKGQ